jgi:hypothetical protein
MESRYVTRKSFIGSHLGPSPLDEKCSLAIARRRQVLGLLTRASTWRTTDADGTGARPPHRLLVSLRVPREHVGFW